MRKVYVMCPAYQSTGGTELLHQLVNKLINKFKIEAYIYYPNVDWKYEYPPTPSKFKKYIGNKWVENLDDSHSNLLIVPETMAHSTVKYNNIEIWLWWLSVDNFFVPFNISYKRFLKPDLKWKIKKFLKKYPFSTVDKIVRKPNIKNHLYQSEYARNFLLNLGLSNIKPLSDYIDLRVISSNIFQDEERYDQVLYNPLKGLEVTQKLIQLSPDIKWIPIQKMKPEEIAHLMACSKVYIDFGHHPGKDRMPREAALNGCCVIVNKEGAANNMLDINIPEEFKVDNPLMHLNKIVGQIKTLFSLYNEKKKEFDGYKLLINKEEEIFEHEIESLFNYN